MMRGYTHNQEISIDDPCWIHVPPGSVLEGTWQGEVTDIGERSFSPIEVQAVITDPDLATDYRQTMDARSYLYREPPEKYQVIIRDEDTTTLVNKVRELETKLQETTETALSNQK